eukprot:TRINITY_DN1644_c0_g3_i7.p2 TRINITY_DN1644_c0_g3~~TRINITY_DN1644_c0_g3_i7.p2  ORF type:complete len:104 (-),score=39.71 TRINITY_DN1644_c0_g3_i7:242-553(-)
MEQLTKETAKKLKIWEAPRPKSSESMPVRIDLTQLKVKAKPAAEKKIKSKQADHKQAKAKPKEVKENPLKVEEIKLNVKVKDGKVKENKAKRINPEPPKVFEE